MRLGGAQGADYWFSEHQGCYILASKDDSIARIAADAGIECEHLGRTQDGGINADGWAVNLSDLREAHEGFFRDWMEG